jgi:hypothetical protein
MRVLMVLIKAVVVYEQEQEHSQQPMLCGNTATISRSVTWTADITPPTFYW